MNPNTVIKAIHRVCNGHCEYDIKLSESTKSVYCTLYLGEVNTSFRISDHYSKKKALRTFVYQKNTKTKSAERFIRNAVKDLYRKSLYIKIENLGLDAVYGMQACSL